MPRPNKARSIRSEANLARRIAFERKERGWSLEGLADRMTKAGCSIAGSAIYKIETVDPPRRITVDELVAFSTVFGVPVEDLLLPSELLVEQRVLSALKAVIAAQVDLFAAVREHYLAWQRLHSFVDDPEFPGASFAEVSANEAYLLDAVVQTMSDRVRDVARRTASAVQNAAVRDLEDERKNE